MKKVKSLRRLVAVSTLLVSTSLPVWAGLVNVSAQTDTGHASAQQAVEPAGGLEAKDPPEQEVSIEAPPSKEARHQETAWLGVSTVEASEVLSAQLDLPPGVGLIVTYVAPNSPAAKAGIKKNDVLVQFGDQQLVHPAQLRKLVRVEKVGDVARLALYHGGKRQTLEVTLASTQADTNSGDEQGEDFKNHMQELQRQLRDLHIDETVKEQMRVLRHSMNNLKINQKEVQEDIRRGMEQAGKAIQEALRNVTNNDPLKKVFENLARSGVALDDKANVVVRSSGSNTRSLVRSDDSGTIVLLSSPKLYLTAHDKDGKLLFDGPIESAEERAKVPQDLWQRVEPLLDQVRTTPADTHAQPGQ